MEAQNDGFYYEKIPESYVYIIKKSCYFIGPIGDVKIICHEM